MDSHKRLLAERKQQDLFRSLSLFEGGVDFYSNDYLGLAFSEKLHQKITQEYHKVTAKNGSTGSRLLSGNSKYTEQLEQKIAYFHQAENALIYNSGYTANLGLISAIATRETVIIMDELAHASLIDGARLGKAERYRFKHNDVQSLEERLIANADKGKELVVIVESIYSMDGDVCPLRDVLDICKKYLANLIVDEAHSIGVYGENGEGLCQELGIANDVLARIVTYGKAPGIHGAAVIGAQWLKDFQINFSRSLIFSTAPALHQLVAISCSYDCMKTANEEREKLVKNIQYFIKKRKESKKDWLDSPSQIQSLIVAGNSNVIQAANHFQENKINVLPIRKPSVAEGAERIRFCIHSNNTTEEIDLIFELEKAISCG